MDALIKMLQNTAGTGEIITVAYGGGSRPGHPRQLTVTSCTDTDLSIREIEGGPPKQYKISKILWAEDSSGYRVTHEAAIAAFHPGEPPVELPVFDTLEHYAAYLRPEIESAGWYLHQHPGLLGVGTFFKNGKPRKAPSITVTYQDRSTETVWDLEKNDLVTQQREPSARDRPWRVDSERVSGKTFSRLDHAMKLFIKEVRDSKRT